MQQFDCRLAPAAFETGHLQALKALLTAAAAQTVTQGNPCMPEQTLWRCSSATPHQPHTRHDARSGSSQAMHGHSEELQR